MNFSIDSDNRRDELIRVIEHAVSQLSLEQLEALYYDMLIKDYIKA
jgi:hypothetical protein